MPLHAPRNRFPPAALTLCLALILFSAFALNGLLWLASPVGYKETVLQHSWDVLHGRGSDDSWGAMQVALDYTEVRPRTTPLYTEIFFNRQYRFQYPPSSLFALAGMLRLAGPDRVRTNEVQVFDRPPLNDLIGWGFLLITALSVAALLEIRRRKVETSRESRLLLAARLVLVAGLALTFYPVVKAYTLGQIQVWINGLFALALLCWALGAKAWSGVLIGLVCLIKPHYALFLAWALLRREWGFIAACATAMGVGLVASVAVFGWENHLDYVRVVSFLSQHGETYYPNQSLNGVLNRLMSIADPALYKSLEFPAGQFPPFNPWIYGATLITSVAILGTALFRRGTEGDPGRVVDFCTIGLSCTLASPIAWEHHYGILLPIFAVLLAAAAPGQRWILWLALSYVLASTFVPATNLLAATPLNFAQSYLFVAALIILALLHRRPWAVTRHAAD